ncbi:MAG: hypothetical protein V7765_20420 [Oleispira sp.]
MFKRTTILCLLCCSALLSACASNPNSFWHTSTEQLIDNHYYQKAIVKITANIPIDQKLLLKVKKLAKKQRRKQTQKINLLVKQQKWGQARDTFKQLKSKQPNPTYFTKLNLLIDNAQFEEERLINTQRTLLEAELLDIQFTQQDLSGRIRNNKTNWFSQSDDLISQKQQLAEKLLHLSTQALVVKDYKNAQKAYVKAIEFDRQLSTGEITQAINKGLSQQNNKAINERQNSLIKQLYFAISTHNFDYIIEIQGILSNEPFHGSAVEKVLRKAKSTRLQHAIRLDDIASKQYRKGNISFAVTQWQQALSLTPTEIRIQEKLIRAQKVQRKLEKLTATEESFIP